MLPIMTHNDLLSTLRALPEEAGPTRVDQIITQLLLENNHLEDVRALSEFVEDLPLDLRRPTSMHIYRDVH